MYISLSWCVCPPGLPSRDCGNVSVVSVVPEVSVSACVEDCGVYGECRLLRSYSYLYAACACKAGMMTTQHTRPAHNTTSPWTKDPH